ncbi:MAG: alpha-mannosidase [Chloroflexi bacterium]|nr:alpha-mannosidase [Chloroflexota bacterium]
MESLLGTSIKTRTLHMIGNAHIDPVWLWQWHEGFHEVKATFRSALDRMKEYDDFIFVASSAAFYDWVEKSDPAMFAEIKQRVREGRWQVVGGWWIEPDCNIPGGESFVRQGLYGQRYFKEKLGVTARVGFNVDSFGHSGTLPQILKKSGLSYYVFLRPMPHEKSLPSRLFWWEADDGSRVLAFRIAFEYLSWGKELDIHVRRCADEMKDPQDEFMCFYGVGNHGGGPTRENLESIYRLNADPDLPTLVLSSPEAFFESVESKNWHLPVVHSDLQKHASGCYAAHSGIKRWNRLAENRLLAAEKWSILAAHTTGQPYSTDFERAWKSVLFNQFHDILAGTSLEAAYDDARDSYGEALTIADRQMNYAVQSFAWNIHIEPEAGMKPIVVFNPHTWPVKANVELEMYRWEPSAVLVAENGQRIPHQEVQSATSTGRVRLSFMADLPALGYRTYRLLPKGEPAETNPVQASDTVLENERLRLEFDPQTGYIARLYDKQAQVEVFKGDAATPVVIDDRSDTWGHDVFRFDQIAGAFKAVSVRLVEHGPVKSVIRVTSEYGKSTLVQDFTMYPNRSQIDVNVVVDWREQLKVLKLRFPINVDFMKVTHEVPYGTIEQFANGEELPVQSWVDVSGIARGRGNLYGFSLLNDGKYSLDVNVRDIGLTVLRSPAYAHHVPHTLKPGALHSYIDQGIQRFSYSMLPHAGSWEQAGTVKRAAELNQRPIALVATYHPEGKLPQADCFIDVKPDNVIVSVLKKAEDNDDMIIRAYETTKSACKSTIHLTGLARTIETQFAPGEIKTFRVPRDLSQPIVETNLLEWEE